MARGGARNRSGPALSPTSNRTRNRLDRGQLQFRQLPPEGRDGRAPNFPLPKLTSTGEPLSDGDEYVTKRERQIWRQYWKTPQAVAWEEEPWRWLIVAQMCRCEARAEYSGNAALIGQVHRYHDQLGLTPAGMRENGWVIGEAVEEVEAPRAAGGAPGGARARLRAVASE
ncbi:hypothetical protein ACU19_04870 [Actinobaculum suis]|uniref:hypothetical protein n=1 Tax=Actinobaculum suis TaxID=1657 RepID=UPI0006A101F4|nr:hypothetical protein [Actinobaculum suis]KMY23307.1 hypothetical protein ACU19_04870 [Actinobaculum suis]